MEQAKEQIGSEARTEPAVLHPLRTPTAVAICAGAWFVPGLGHIILGRWVRGLIFAGCVLIMFGLGLAMQGKLYGLAFEDPLQEFAFIANIGAGLPYFLSEYFGFGAGIMTAPSYDYGTTFLWVAGLLNFLIVLDVFDIAKGRKP